MLEKIIIENSKLIYHFDVNDKIHPEMFAVLSDEFCHGLFQPDFTQKAGKKTFTVDLDNLITLKKYLSIEVTRHQMLKVFFDIARIINQIRAKFNSFETLILDENHIFVEAENQKVLMFLVPVLTETEPIVPETFFKGILTNVRFDTTCDNNYIAKLMNLLNLETFHMGDFLKLLGSFDENLEEAQKNEAIMKLVRTSKESQGITETKVGLYQEHVTSTSMIYHDEYDDNGETTVLSPVDISNAIPSITRMKTNKRVNISPLPFVIGKNGHGVSYDISENSAVSRIHAEIGFDNDHYFITDKGSTNHTFLNGVMLDENRHAPLKHGDMIGIGNEQFRFDLY